MHIDVANFWFRIRVLIEVSILLSAMSLQLAPDEGAIRRMMVENRSQPFAQ